MSNSQDFGPSEVHAIDARASELMKRGIRLMESSRPDDIAEALACFDDALELRRGLPIEANPILGYGLAACWLNRADALLRLPEGPRVDDAMRAYDAAIVLLHGLPLLADPRFPRRLAIAHQNRGLALQSQVTADPAAAISAFSDAIAVLDHDQAALVADRRYLLAAIWMNLANAHAGSATVESATLARDAALHAMVLVADLEADDADAAEVGLKARHVLCQTLARRLSLPAADGRANEADVHQATDAVDDGLHLARRWEQRGVSRFRGVACDLFRFGARVYAHYQPHFLHEYVLDNTDPAHSSSAYVGSTEMRSAAREALELTTLGDH